MLLSLAFRRTGICGIILALSFSAAALAGHEELRQRIDALLRGGEENAALRVLQEAIAADPSESYCYRKLAEIHTRLGDLGEAANVLEQGGSNSRLERYALYREAALLRERRGEPGQALLDYRAMLRCADPDQARSLGKGLFQHLAYLSLLVDGPPGLSRVPAVSGIDASGGPTLRFQAPAVSKAKDAAEKKNGLVVPGGIAILARTLGVDVSVLKEHDATERIFSYILEDTPDLSEKDNPLRRDSLSCLKHYDALARHLRKYRLTPAASKDRAGSQEYVFPLAAGKDDSEKARRFLAFFGINYKAGTSGSGETTVTLTQSGNLLAMERQRLLRSLGVNLLDPNLREIRFSLGNDELPLFFGADVWDTRILANKKAEPGRLLERFLSNTGAMRLYVALAGCSDETRDGLLASVSGADLLGSADSLLAFGRHIEFSGSRLVLPGSRASWEALLGASSQGGLVSALLRDQGGRALLLYYTLSVAPRSVQSYLTFSPERLSRFYQQIHFSAPSRLLRAVGVVGRNDLGRVLRRLSADERGLLLPVDRRFAGLLMSPAARGFETGSHRDLGPVRVDPDGLVGLLARGSIWTPILYFTAVDTLEFLSYLQAARPEVVADESIAALLNSPMETPLFLDLIWDLNPPPDLLVRFLDYCRKLSLARSEGWNVDRTRTSQSIFYLLSALCHEGTISHEDGVELLAQALQALNTAEEGNFAQAAARFLSQGLLPLLGRLPGRTADSPDLVLEALSGAREPAEFKFEGQRFELDFSAHALARMKGVIQQQRFTPLPDLLGIYQALDGIQSRSAATADELKNLRARLGEITAPDLAPSASRSTRAFVAHAEVSGLQRRIDEFLRGPKAVSAAQLAAEMAAGLHPELGVTLLTYCYAYAGSPDTDALAFDVNFIRRHAFYDKNGPSTVGWEPAHVELRQDLGTFIEGSLSGLAYGLCQLETAQSAQGFGTRGGKALVPTLLSDMRTIRRALRTDRAQEYVALSVRLGRELLALSALDARAGAWLEKTVSSIASPRRREQVSKWLSRYDSKSAAEVLSPSELFLLGEAYLKGLSQVSRDASPVAANVDGRGGNDAGAAADDGSAQRADSPPAMASPVLERLIEIVPKAGSADAGVFRKEVEQYGIPLRRRLGINETSLALADSYEQLERTAREEVLYERICDMKIRVAELNYALGLPAVLGKEEGEVALRQILPKAPEVRTDSWKLALEKISRLGTEDARRWINELLSRGFLVSADKR